MLFFVNTSHLIQKSSRSRDQNISLDAILTCPQIDPEYENAHAVYMKKVLSVNQSIAPFIIIIKLHNITNVTQTLPENAVSIPL